jgi:predicted dinucleotide-binding enzyme
MLARRAEDMLGGSASRFAGLPAAGLRRFKRKPMRIVSVGKGRIDGGLAKLWTAAGHDILSLGRDGCDASSADVILVAVPSSAIGDALSRVTGQSVGQRSMQPTSMATETPTSRLLPTRSSRS